MKNHVLFAVAGICLLAASGARAGTSVTVEHLGNAEATQAFAFKTVPHPSANDAATTAKILIASGEADPNGASLDKLHDGKLPDEADQPQENFFFDAGTEGGRLQMDLGRVIDVRQVNSYSWHPNTRGPQKYKLYGSDGTAKDFNALPKAGTSPAQCGWNWIATVDTTSKSDDVGGQYGVSIANPDGKLGRYRYLLFDIFATERDDDFGNTFYSEIDVIDADAPTVTEPVAQDTALVIKTVDGKNTITIDTKQAPELKDWAEHKLAPALADWYPKIAAQLPSDGYTAPDHFKITIKPMDGVAYTTGTGVFASADWLQKEIGGEAVGSLIHEAVHVVQQYGDGAHNPGWLVEGCADYIRWFKYEPQSHGADIVWMRKHGKNFSPHYNDSYRITANFLDWVTQKYDHDIVAQLNAAMHAGTYDESLWQKYTGKSVSQLGTEWKLELTAQLSQKN